MSSVILERTQKLLPVKKYEMKAKQSHFIAFIILLFTEKSVLRGKSSAMGDRTQRLHWLPVRHRITYMYKLCVLVHTGSSPSYLSGLVTATANIPFRKRLRSADSTPIAANRSPPPDSSSVNGAFHQSLERAVYRASGLNEPQCIQTPAEDISV